MVMKILQILPIGQTKLFLLGANNRKLDSLSTFYQRPFRRGS